MALEQFFTRGRAEDLRRGVADTGGDPVLVRAMKQVASKGPEALRIAETIIDLGSQRTLAEGLQLEVDFCNEIFRTADALTGLTFRTLKQLGSPAFVGR